MPLQWCTVRLIALSAIAVCPGCLTAERSFPFVEADTVAVGPDDVSCCGRPLSARAWAVAAQERLRVLLSPGNQDYLTTDELRTASGCVRGVFGHFGINPERLESLFGNFAGLIQTAAVLSGGHRGVASAKPWPGFVPIDITMEDGVRLAARISNPEPGGIPGSFVVVSHGLFGNLAGKSPYETVDALRRFGHRVLAVEMRGHGDTLLRRPDVPIEWGIGESRDLLTICRWLRRMQGARRVGLLMASQLAHHALLAAWLDGRRPEPQDAGSPIFATLPAPDPEPAFDGLIAVSPPIDLVGIADRQTRRHSFLKYPVQASLEKRVEERMAVLGAGRTGRFWDLIEFGIKRSRWASAYPDWCTLRREGLRFLDFRVPNWDYAVQRMESVRAPVLILHAGSDPLASAQEVADLFGRVCNPNVAVIMTHGGGHTGFPAMSASYYFSLLKAFFDPTTAPAPVPVRGGSAEAFVKRTG